MEVDQKLRHLLSIQPKNLTYREKLVRIDRLSCFERESEMAVNPNLWSDKYISFCTILDYLLAKEYPQLLEMAEFKESLLYSGFLSCEKHLESLSYTELSSLGRQYTIVRREVLTALNE